MENGSEASFSTGITEASESPPQLSQVCDNSKRTKIRREVEGTERTSLSKQHFPIFREISDNYAALSCYLYNWRAEKLKRNKN